MRNSVIGAIGAVIALAAPICAAQDYPTKPIRVIVPFTAGSATDTVARAFGERLHATLGQPVTIENRAGAGGSIGAAAVAQAAPDGYTVLIHSSGHTANAALYPNLTYKTEIDFAGVTPLANLPNVLVIAPAKNIKTVGELVAAAKAKPGALNYASAGIGSGTHMNAEMFRARAKFDAVHVPFRGTPEALTETLAGRVDYFFSPLVAALGQIREGKLLALAVGSAERSPLLPQVPTTVEAGWKGSDYNFWIGMMVPAKTPRPIVDKLHGAVTAALETPEMKKRFADMGASPMPMKPEQFDAHIKAEVAAIGELIRAVGIKAQ